MSNGTQFIEDWTGDQIGQPPSNWTNLYGGSGITAEIVELEDRFITTGRGLKITSTTSNPRVLTWDTVGSVEDVDVLLGVRFPNPQIGQKIAILVRGSGNNLSSLSAYAILFDIEESFGDGLFTLWIRWYMYIDGEWVSFGGASGSGFTIYEDELEEFIENVFWVRLRVNGEDYYGDEFGFGPPYVIDEEFGLLKEASDISGPGWVGIGTFGAGEYIVSPVGLAIDGDLPPIPFGPPTPGEPTQFQFTFEDETPGQPPSQWEIFDGWNSDTDDYPSVVITNEGTMKMGTGHGVYAVLVSTHPDLQNVWEMELLQRVRFAAVEWGWSAGGGNITIDGHEYSIGGGVWFDPFWEDHETPVYYAYAYTPLDYIDWDEELPLTVQPNEWYYVRTRFDGSDIYVSMWKASDDPPETEWHFSLDDPTLMFVRGPLQLSVEDRDLNGNAYVEWDYIGVGINGAPAPMPGDMPVVVTYSAQTVRSLKAQVSKSFQTVRSLGREVSVTAQTVRSLAVGAQHKGQTLRRLSAGASAEAQTLRRLGPLSIADAQTLRQLAATAKARHQTIRSLAALRSISYQTLRRLHDPRWKPIEVPDTAWVKDPMR